MKTLLCPTALSSVVLLGAATACAQHNNLFIILRRTGGAADVTRRIRIFQPNY